MRVLSIILCISLFIITFAMANKDYYSILGVDKNANEKQIKSAYKQLSLKYHPDKNPGNEEAHEKFLEVGEAYEVLGNSEKRSNYDQFGDPNGRPQPQQFDFGDMFGHFFGGQGGQPGQRRGDSTQVNMNVELKDFYNGKLLEFDLQMRNICDVCDGTGSKDKKTHTCRKCDGSGYMTIRHQLAPGMFQQVRTGCDECGGKGKIITNKCNSCHGHGVKNGQRHYEVYVKPGQPRDSNIVLHGEGDKHPDLVPGDLIINLREEFSKGWGYRRINNNLYRTEVLTLNESITGGWSRLLKFFDDTEDTIKLSRKEGQVVTHGEIEVIKGKGMPVYEDHDHDGTGEEYGDLFIEYKVVIPGADIIAEYNKNNPVRDEL
ncbi:dnaJ-like protein in endoplasmic reticulum [Scheffersomyces amazonensis]|uniref:dnaJ-like protein in endoplasmic reticulum n=1 Tax=Scheffersomyces amazonensis TaxID=1078765 RepID=UPI00315CCF1C